MLSCLGLTGGGKNSDWRFTPRDKDALQFWEMPRRRTECVTDNLKGEDRNNKRKHDVSVKARPSPGRRCLSPRGPLLTAPHGGCMLTSQTPLLFSLFSPSHSLLPMSFP